MKREKKQKLGSEIRARRMTKGLTLNALARLLRITPGFLSKIENSAELPSAALTLRAADLLGVNGETWLKLSKADHLDRLSKKIDVYQARARAARKK